MNCVDFGLNYIVIGINQADFGTIMSYDHIFINYGYIVDNFVYTGVDVAIIGINYGYNGTNCVEVYLCWIDIAINYTDTGENDRSI